MPMEDVVLLLIYVHALMVGLGSTAASQYANKVTTSQTKGTL